MSKRIWNLRFLSISLLMGSLLGLAGCAPSVVAEGQLKPTPAVSVTLPPYPGPTINPTALTISPPPSWAEQNRWWAVTPLPNEQLMRGEIVEIQPTTLPASPYSIRKDSKPSNRGYQTYMLFLRNSKTGEEIRLGDDNGDAILELLTDQYLIWRYNSETYDEKAKLNRGLYAYHLATGKQITIANSVGYQGQPEMSGEWVIYMDNEPAKDNVFGLRAHNLATGEDLWLSRGIPIPPGRLTKDLYAMNENKIAWVELNLATNSLAIMVYDLDERTGRKLETPLLTEPLFVGVSNEVVTWRDGSWKGYFLRSNTLFTIPVIPPGWEDVPIREVKPVTAQGNRLYWSFKVDDEFHYFTAPILPKGQGPKATHVVPTPHRKPMTPTPIPLPTAYP